MNAHTHTHTHSASTCVQMDAQEKITSDYAMKPAAATRVTTLTLVQGLKRNNQNAAKKKKKKKK